MAVDAPVDVWREPRGHAATLRGLWRAARAERLPHALLLHGRPGIGKFLAARWLALGLLCAQPAQDGAPCCSCGPCKRAMRGSHGDLLFVDVRDEAAKERSEELRIGRFTPRPDNDYWSGPTVEDFLGLRALEGGWRIVIVREAERANNEAQNTMLKMLEEPPRHVLWLLETAELDLLLPTIKSRCVPVALATLGTAETEAVLAAEGVDRERARLFARWSRGSPGLALELSSKAGVELRQLLADLLGGRARPLEAARALWELEGEFSGKTPKAAERQRARFALDLWLDALRDLHALHAGASAEAAPHGDLAAGLADAPRRRAGDELGRTIETLLGLRRDVDLNLDPPALLDSACAALAAPAAP